MRSGKQPKSGYLMRSMNIRGDCYLQRETVLALGESDGEAVRSQLKHCVKPEGGKRGTRKDERERKISCQSNCEKGFSLFE